MITISHREKEGKKIYKKIDKLLEQNSDKINSMTDIKKLRDLSLHLAKELRGFQHMYYELFFKLVKSNRPEYSKEIQLKMYIYYSAQDYIEFAKANKKRLTRRNALNIAIGNRLKQNSSTLHHESITSLEKKFRKIELERINSENELLNRWEESISDLANNYEAQSFLQGFANFLTKQS